MFLLSIFLVFRVEMVVVWFVRFVLEIVSGFVFVSSLRVMCFLGICMVMVLSVLFRFYISDGCVGSMIVSLFG